MKVHKDEHAGALRATVGGTGVPLVVGLIFSLLFLVMAVGASSSLNRVATTELLIIVGVVGAFGVAGLILVFGRKGVVVQRHAGTIETWWGLVVPLRRRVRCKLDELDRVLLERKEVRTRNGTTYTFPVQLVPRGGRPILVANLPDPWQGRRSAETFAGFCGRPLHDSTSGAELVRPPEFLDENVVDRHLRLVAAGKGEDLSVPAPARLLSTLEDRGDVLSIEIPPGGRAGAIAMAVFSLLLGSVAAVLTYTLSDAPANDPALVLAAVGALLLPVVVTVRRAVWPAWVATRIEVDAEALSVRGPDSSGVIPVRGLEELEVLSERPGSAKQGATGIHFASDRLVLRVGAHLDVDELRYLRSRILAQLVVGVSPGDARASDHASTT